MRNKELGVENQIFFHLGKGVSSNSSSSSSSSGGGGSSGSNNIAFLSL